MAGAPYCANVARDDGYLHDSGCNSNLPFVCECDENAQNPDNY